jgi:hypothetical protein
MLRLSPYLRNSRGFMQSLARRYENADRMNVQPLPTARFLTSRPVVGFPNETSRGREGGQRGGLAAVGVGAAAGDAGDRAPRGRR